MDEFKRTVRPDVNAPAPKMHPAPISQRQINKKNYKISKSKIILISLAVLAVFILAVVPSYYFYHKSQQAEARLNDPNTVSKEVIDLVVKKVSHHILLPSSEQPTLATVSDASKVKGQPFFQNAQNGDKVLVFTQARKAYLYRPGTDLVIEVAPLNVDNSPAAKVSK